MNHDVMKFLFEKLHPLTRKCPIHPQNIMKRALWDEELFMYEYYCNNCLIAYSPRVLDQMESDQ